MDLGKYVTQHAAALEAQKEQAKLARERLRDARLLNAETVEKWLQNVVAPVFQTAELQLKEAGGYSEVVWESMSDPKFPVSPVGPEAANLKTFALRIDLGTQPNNDPHGRSYLGYTGSFDDCNVVHTTYIAGSGKSPTTIESLKIEQVHSAVIEGHVDSFVQKAFTLKS